MQRTNNNLIHCLQQALWLVLLCLLPFNAAANQLSPQEQRGKLIYHTGKSPSGEAMNAFFGEQRIVIPASASPCASCHGYDGTGRPESGLIPSNVTWKYLTKSYGHRHANGVEHPPFDESSLKEYLLDGDFPTGIGGGDPNMPLYDMSQQDLDDLVVYMKRLGTLNPPGITAGHIRIATLLPLEGPLAPLGKSIQQTLSAYLAQTNAAGGIFGRKLELVTYPLPGDGAFPQEKIADWLAEQQPFALLSPVLIDPQADLNSLQSALSLPAVGPFTLFPQTSYAQNRQSFYLYAGLGEQISALLKFMAPRKVTLRNLAIIYPENRGLNQLVAGINAAANKYRWEHVREIPYQPEALSEEPTTTAAKQSDLMVFLGDGQQAETFLSAMGKTNWRGEILIPGILAGDILRKAPETFVGRLHLSYPTLPSDRQPWGQQELAQLQNEPSGQRHLQARISAYVAAKILIEAMRKAGRQIDQQKLIGKLESFYQYQTGLTPPLSFSSNRHVGSLGAHIITFKAKQTSLRGQWIDLE